jgi:hypothetical protein
MRVKIDSASPNAIAEALARRLDDVEAVIVVLVPKDEIPSPAFVATSERGGQVAFAIHRGIVDHIEKANGVRATSCLTINGVEVPIPGSESN